jgi:hypothetical protein
MTGVFMTSRRYGGTTTHVENEATAKDGAWTGPLWARGVVRCVFFEWPFCRGERHLPELMTCH